MGTGFRICKGVMVTCQVKPARCGDSLELVVRETMAEMPAGSRKRIIKNIIGTVHPVDPESSLQAASVEARVVGDQWESVNQGICFFPDVWKYRGILGIFRAQPMDSPAKPLIIRLMYWSTSVRCMLMSRNKIP